MAFSLQYFEKLGQSQQYDKTYNAATGSCGASIIQSWVYDGSASKGNASTAQVIASGYFNGASGYLSVGDIIFAESNTPATVIMRVNTNSAGTVTTTQTV